MPLVVSIFNAYICQLPEAMTLVLAKGVTIIYAPAVDIRIAEPLLPVIFLPKSAAANEPDPKENVPLAAALEGVSVTAVAVFCRV